VAIALMLVGIGFVAVLTAAVASLFVKHDRKGEDMDVAAALARIERDLADLKARLPA
jgi:hypothetical protein